jgi:HSP20 family molecular chaperone IbpA
MTLLHSRPVLDILQFLAQTFQNLGQTCESTLWVCDSGVSQPFSLDLQETGTLLIVTVQFHHSRGSLDLHITPETVLVKGERLNPSDKQNHSELALLTSRFQSLIPLPKSIQPLTAIAELSGKTLTLTLMKSHEAQRTAKITVGERGQLLPYAMATSTESALAELN